MNKIDQTCFGGKDASLEQQGNCFQACVATVLQMPLEEAFDNRRYSEDWLDEFNKWLERYGLWCIYIFGGKDNPMKVTEFRGLCIGEFMSKTLYQGERHVIVLRDHFEVFHDPNPNAKGKIGDFQGVYVFVPLEAYKMVRI